MRKNLGFYLLSGAICAAGGMQANAVTINGYDFDLSQFDGATVTTSYHHDGHIHGNTWDNLVGVDHYTLGELATAQYGFDPGDHISLGDYSAQDSFTLTYGTGFYIGTGQSSMFVVYESSGRQPGEPDTGRTGWDISFNGGDWISASSAHSISLYTEFAPSHGQIVFDLTQHGFSLGEQITTVSIRNHIGVGPDFTFAAHAGTSAPLAPVPEPGSLTLLGLGLLGMAVRRRRNRTA
jgi:hypothetical protein